MTDKIKQDFGNLDEFSIINEITQTLSESEIRPVDVISVLQENSDRQLYYRTDHHWTTEGAYLAYETYLSGLGMNAVTPDESLRNEQEGFLGTYYSKAKKYDVVSDTIVWYDLPVDRVTINGESVDGLYDLSKLDTRDKYSMFLNDNNGITVIENESAPAGSILVIKDSYANCFVPFLTQSFSRVVVVDLRYLPQGLGDLISQESFDRTLFLYNFENLASDQNFYRLKY
jgi:hypothetical protein